MGLENTWVITLSLGVFSLPKFKVFHHSSFCKNLLSYQITQTRSSSSLLPLLATPLQIFSKVENSYSSFKSQPKCRSLVEDSSIRQAEPFTPSLLSRLTASNSTFITACEMICFQVGLVWALRMEILSLIFFLVCTVQLLAHGSLRKVEWLKLVLLVDLRPQGATSLPGYSQHSIIRGPTAGVAVGTPVPANPAFENSGGRWRIKGCPHDDRL